MSDLYNDYDYQIDLCSVFHDHLYLIGDPKYDINGDHFDHSND